MSVNFRSLLASLLALFTIAFCPAAFAATAGGQVTLAPSYKATYRACTGFFTPAASATDIFRISGSASKTVTITGLEIRHQGGGSLKDQLFIIKRSAAASGGTSTTATNVPLDSAQAAATAVVKSYTANPTTGASVGTIAMIYATTDPSSIPFFTNDANLPITRFGRAPVLRGTAEGIAVNGNGVTLGNTSICITVEWTEE